jgi:hypothetical protein
VLQGRAPTVSRPIPVARARSAGGFAVLTYSLYTEHDAGTGATVRLED